MKYSKKRSHYPNYIISFFQLLIHIFFAFLIRAFYRADRTIPQNISELKRGSLLVANHQSMLDPFIVLAYIPFFTFIKILPISFPTCDKFMKRPILSQILKLLGCFNIGNSNREKMLSLFYIRGLLQQGKTVFLFPEGNLIKAEDIGDFKKGIQFFIKECQNTVFVRMRGFNKVNWQSLMKHSRSLTFSQVENFNGREIKTADLKMILEKL